MADVRAADLPPGSIVVWLKEVWSKHDETIGDGEVCTVWYETGSRLGQGDDFIDERLADSGAVLRHGYGEEA